MPRARPLCGMETEYALALLGPGRQQLQERHLTRLLDLARSSLVHLPGATEAGIFLTNGARLYADCGLHPEYATPECASPSDLVRHVKAGDAIVLELTRKLGEAEPRLRPIVFRGNVDYGGSRATWGCHESYLCRDPHRLRPGLLAHLVSRVVLSGSGGFDPRSAGIEFVLSPRAFHLAAPVSGNSTSARGIIHLKQESLCGPGHARLHLLCGDSLCSPVSLWLTVASTSLVVALLDADRSPGAELPRLADPVGAIRTFSRDAGCRARTELAGGGTASALDIQYRLLELIERRGDDAMPPWAGEACALWRRTLDRLARDPGECSRTLDWSIKRALYRRRLQKHGLDAERLGFWNRILARLDLALEASDDPGAELALEHVTRESSPIRSRVLDLTPELRARGLEWDDLGQVLRVRKELFEIEIRYSQLGSEGIFERLARAGAVDHPHPSIDDVRRAMEHPPEGSRARLRGDAVRKLAPVPGSACAWHLVWDGQGRRHLDLADPFAETETWSVPRPRLRRCGLRLRGQRTELLQPDLLALLDEPL